MMARAEHRHTTNCRRPPAGVIYLSFEDGARACALVLSERDSAGDRIRSAGIPARPSRQRYRFDAGWDARTPDGSTARVSMTWKAMR